MAYQAKAIANYFLKLANSKDQRINPMKIQKLVYVAHGWYLAINGEPLIYENVEAWDYGPVIRDLYNEFSSFRGDSINRYATEIDENNSFQEMVEFPEDSSTTDLLNKVYEIYGKFSAIQLSDLTHKKDTPWDNTQLKAKYSVIAQDLIKNHFEELAKIRS